MLLMPKRAALMALALACLLAPLACSDSTREGRPQVDPRDRISHNVYPALHGSISEFAVLATNTPLRVEGYGIVADLPNTGSGDMPPNIRMLMLDQLYKIGSPNSNIADTKDIRPEAILRSNRIAVVEIHGLIPPMAAQNAPFDLYVSAYPGTQTTSLETGVLWTSELKIIGLDETLRSLNLGEHDTSRALAVGRGQVLCQPAVAPSTQPAAATASSNFSSHRNLRRARIPAGGFTMEAMPVSLQLYAPSVRIATLVQRVINARFPNRTPYAAAQSDSVISITIPEAYRSNPREFVELILHMYLSQEVPGFTEKKTAELLTALRDPKAPRNEISLCLQGLGRSILDDYLRPQYTSADPAMRFYCAKAGAGMQDVQAIIALEDIALNEQSPFQNAAVSAIASFARHGDSERATITLSKLLNSHNNSIRLAAYEALSYIGSPAVRTYRINKKFDIDLVYCDAPSLIYASQTGRPRIAIIGNQLTLPPGVLYISPDKLLTVNVPETPEAAAAVPDTAPSAVGAPIEPAPLGGPPAKPDPKDQVQLYYRGPLGDKQITLKSTASLPVILTKLAWVPDPHSANYDAKQPFIGLSYQRVIEMLSAMCQDQSLNATFVLQPAPIPLPTTSDLAEEARPEKAIVFPTTAPTTTTAPTKPI